MKDITRLLRLLGATGWRVPAALALLAGATVAPAQSSVWRIENAANGNVLTNGVTSVGADGLVVVTNVFVLRDPLRDRLAVSPAPAPVVLSGYVPPRATDPALTNFNDPHFVALTTDAGARRNKLLLHLPGTGHEPWQATNFILTAAALGYHAVSLKYQNVPSIAGFCALNADLDCYRNVAEENVTGAFWADTDPTATKQVTRTDSVTNRAAKLLAFLSTNALTAAGGWGQFLGPGGIQWHKVAVSGHSQGGSTALLLAKMRAVERAVLFSTVDWVHSPTNDRPPWFAEPGLTPPERLYGFTHFADFGGTNHEQQPIIWNDLGMTPFGPIAVVESNALPFLGSHTLTTRLRPATTNESGAFEYHGSVVIDRAIPTNALGIVTWAPVWSYMLTNVTMSPPCSPPRLEAALLTNGQLELTWPTCTNNDYQVEGSVDLTHWFTASPPLPAGTNGGQTWLVSLDVPYEFFRLRVGVLTNSLVPAGVGTHTNLFITVDGLPRRYALFIPATYAPGVSNPLVFILHGIGQSGDRFAQLHPLLFVHAETNNLILVLPDGTVNQDGPVWNIFDPPIPGRYPVDDVNFILTLLARLDATLTLDRQRLYAGGFSMGGQMSYLLAARTTNVFAAYAAVESSLGNDLGPGTPVLTPPLSSGPASVLIMNCTNSCARPYYGGVNQDGIYMTPAIAAARHWTNANFCAALPTVMTNSFVTNGMSRFNNCDDKPPAFLPQPNQVVVARWAGCAPGTEVIFVTLTDGGHIWPDANDKVGFDANREVLRFFLQHARP